MKKYVGGSSSKTLKFLWSFIKNYRLCFIITIVAAALNALCNVFQAYLIQGMIDGALKGETQSILVFALLIVLLIVVGMISQYAITYSSSKFGSFGIKDMRECLSKHILNTKVSYLEKTHSADLMSRMTSDVNSLEGFMTGDFWMFIYIPLLFLFSFISMLFINWRLLLASFIITPFAAAGMSKLYRPLKEGHKEIHESLGKSNIIVQDAVSGINILKAFNLEGILYDKYKNSQQELIKNTLKVQRYASLVHPFGILMYRLPSIICIFYGGYLAINGVIKPGELVAFLRLLGYVVATTLSFPQKIGALKAIEGIAIRLFEILDYPTEPIGTVCSFDKLKDSVIEFKNVEFFYDKDKKVLENVSFNVNKGHTVALVGSSGSGKSTILNLLCNFYDIKGGHISVYGKNLYEYDLKTIRNEFSLVSQDSYLFPVSVEENIRLGALEATKEEIIAAAKAANAHDFILELPEGYDTLVGERGMKLSGGQKQRIAIARAILKNAPILLLDEPTSALDTQSEALVQQALNNLGRDKTVLVIAHRLSTIKEADEVLVLDNGSIVERGSHSYLMENGSLYKQLYLKQFALNSEDDSKEEEG
ncbi:ABC transporter ATP-binding protein [Desnuesiella massiliensis]|uniref:ABC transporter ATP-binding protein n=1 Tax=Desnuesiella massiliensis TaxID=1650662 RepID=UPI0006E412FB|nr:ABC transporter ATP-binding protein [Desnuesiella massiliensis]